LVSRAGSAAAGTHPASVSTYDTRASSVVFSYRHGFSEAGDFNTASYNANFTSTSGRLSAQFGLHYVNFNQKDYDAVAHGVAGSGVAVYSLPVMDRYEDGVPKAALAFHLGGVPTAFVSGEHNFLTLPFVLGLGVPLSPSRFFTITPWYELAISVNADSVISTDDIPIDESWIRTDPNTGRPISLSPDAVNQALAQGVTMDVSVAVPMRFGVEAALHATRTVDFNLYGMFSTLGAAFSGRSVATIGGSFLVRWDDIAPAVLPPKKEDDSCEAVERRFRACPVSQQWLSPEQQKQPSSVPASVPPPPVTPATLPPAAPPPAAPPASTPPSPPPSAPEPGPAAAPAPAGQSAFPN
jgi:hypothetical protein